ncbi:hypothetical protein ACFRKB_06385 [Streptomyces scopuliridis]|uniref:hypothetical protein n=1 Tax=Streptomyces scopuliridis TaxID=452529 RepID=UPI0036A3680C
MTQSAENEPILRGPGRDLLDLPGVPGLSHLLDERVPAASEEARERILAQRR